MNHRHPTERRPPTIKTVYATPRRGSALPANAAAEPATAFITEPEPPAIPRGLLPPRLSELLSCTLRGKRGQLEEIRLRADRRATLTVNGENLPTPVMLTTADLTAILTHLCGESLYAYSQTINQGYITLPDGIRVGVAGRAVCEEGRVIGVCEITGLCIRLPHRHRNLGREICDLIRKLNEGRTAPQGVLIYAPPGEGKTTLLRAVAAGMAGADGRPPLRTVVVDTRGELSFACDDPASGALCLDVLRGYPRARGVEIATRTLSAQLIICDEIGDLEESVALTATHHGGVPLVATAHGGSVEELMHRTGIRLLHEARLFGAYVGIRRNGRGGFWYDIQAREEIQRY